MSLVAWHRVSAVRDTVNRHAHGRTRRSPIEYRMDLDIYQSSNFALATTVHGTHDAPLCRYYAMAYAYDLCLCYWRLQVQ